MAEPHLQFLSELIKKRSGIVISDDKTYLLETRLANILRKRKLETLRGLADEIQLRWDPALINEVIDAMTTNESLFFRDIRPFDAMKNIVLPELLERNKNSRAVRVWSAACSHGQEAYSLAMIWDEQKNKFPGWAFEVMATDIANPVLERAKQGLFSQFEVQRGLPITHLVKYFTQVDTQWRINDALKQYVKFQYFNLLESPAPLGRFDVIFCRNVLIYFDAPTKSQILDRLASVMVDDGYLFLGGAETIIGLTQRFEAVKGQTGMFKKVGGAKATTPPATPTVQVSAPPSPQMAVAPTSTGAPPSSSPPKLVRR